MVFIDGDPVAFSTSNTINWNTNTTEISTKDHGLFPSTIVQSQTWEVTCENLASADSINTLFLALNKAKDNTPCVIKVAKPSNWNDKGIVGTEGASTNWDDGTGADIIAQGDCLLTSLSLNAPGGDNASLSATFTGTGAFTLTASPADISGHQAQPGPSITPSV